MRVGAVLQVAPAEAEDVEERLHKRVESCVAAEVWAAAARFMEVAKTF